MKLTLLAVGRTTEDYLRRGIEIYVKRLGHYVPFEMKELPDLRATRGMGPEDVKRAEGAAVLGSLEPGDVVWLLDERGEELTSPELATRLQRRMASGLKRMVLVIGGPYGFSQAVYERADGKLSLSRLTFSHQMVRLFAVEQLYRAMTILRGEPYHHQ